MIKASRRVVTNAVQQPNAVDVGSEDSVAFDSTLVASERIAFSADRLDSLRVAQGRPTHRFFGIPLGQRVALGEDACHFRHVLGSPSAQRDDRVSQAATERRQRVVHARWYLLVVGPR